MPLTPGTRLGPYEIVAPLGAGGMGEVWRARDTRLARDVAIKALPAAFAQDPERLARLEREAKLLASLSHPNVAAASDLLVPNPIMPDFVRWTHLCEVGTSNFLFGAFVTWMLTAQPRPTASGALADHVSGTRGVA